MRKKPSSRHDGQPQALPGFARRHCRAEEGRQVEEAAEVLDKRFTPDGKAYLGSLSGLLDLQRKSIDANAARIEDLYERSRTFMIVLGLVVLALGVVCMASDARHYDTAGGGGG
jgi:hypothetical protein